MNHSGDAADQIVNMAGRAVEVVANVGGRAALSLATFLMAAIKSQKRTKGRARMQAFNGKPTKVFVIRGEDMKIFAQEARKYGVLYAAVVNKKQPDGLVDVVVNANDAAKVDRIAERFALSTVDVEKIRNDIEKKQKGMPEKERTTPDAEKPAHTVNDNMLDEMLGEEPKTPEQKQPMEIHEENPTKAGTVKQEKLNPSAPISGNKGIIGGEDAENRKPPVREQIKDIRKERKAKATLKQPQKSLPRQTVHRQPKNRKKTKGKAR